MLNEQTMEKLRAMKLNGIADAFKGQLEQPDIHQLSFEERFGLLVDRQWIWKEDRRMKRLLGNAKLKINACIEDIDYKIPRGIDRSVVLRLASCHWIQSTQNIIITGPTGVGKTYLSCAFANKVCREGFSALYRRAPRLFQELAIARADGSYTKLMNKFAKAKIAIVTDYRGLTVSELEELRVELRKCDSEIRVAKNTLLRRAVEGTPFEPMTEHFKGTCK